jgi:pentatricopeptide repeat protein
VPTHTLNWCIKTLGGQGRLDLAQALFHWMRLRHAANEHSYVKLCEACEAARAPRAAMQAWRDVQRMRADLRLGQHAAAALLKTYRAAGDLPGALTALEEIQKRGCPVNQYAHNIVLRLCADLGDADGAMAVLGALRASASAAARPDARTYSAVLGAVAAARKWSRTVAVHKLMKEDGVALDAPLAAQLLGCFAEAGRPEAAEAVLDAMQDGERRSRVRG